MKVMGVYRHGLTLLGEINEIVYLTWVEKPGPYTIFVPGLEALAAQVQTGQQVEITAQEIQLPQAGFSIGLDTAVIFPDKITVCLAERGEIEQTIAQVAHIANQLQLSASECLNAYLATCHQMQILSSPTLDGIARALRQQVFDFLAVQRSRDPTVIQRSLLSMLGFGPGLTPAGDDFLAGWLAACAAIYAHPGQEQHNFQDLIEAIIHQAPLRTHPLSSALIWAAVQGEIDHTLKQILADILSGRSIQPDQLRQLAETGHSSGLDGLAGALSFLEYYLAQ